MTPESRALRSLEGLSVGDAFGETFLRRPASVARLAHRALPDGPWPWTDDTAMAREIVRVLGAQGHIDGDALAQGFARSYASEPWRGYGGGAMRLLRSVAAGASWQTEASAMFGGTGSMGNGSAMRVAPLGAWYANDLDRVVAEATASSAVTHTHAEGIAGAVAVAVAAASARTARARSDAATWLLDTVWAHTPPSEVRRRIDRARDIAPSTDPMNVAREIGSGQRILSLDTVPFAVWCAAHHLDDYADALWTTATGLGDIDTTCAMVGGIVALTADVPETWVERREPLVVGP